MTAAPIYLDYAATTPVDPRVAELMVRHLTADGVFGNPGSHSHVFGWAAQKAIEQAREQVAELIHAQPREIIWTSGATESNNLAIKGLLSRQQGGHIVTSKTEHKAVLDPCRQLQRQGYTVTYLDPDSSGLISLDSVAAALRDDTVLVSIMHVNNETGVAQDLEAIGKLARSRGIVLHVDAAQSAGKLPLNLQALDVDLMSFSAHKVYGPKGIGALYVRHRPGLRLHAQLHGGGQERGLRAGTLATHQIVGMGAAFAIARETLAEESARLLKLRQRLWQGLENMPAVYLNGDPRQRVAGILNISFAYVDGEALLMELVEHIAVSSGSACASANLEPSHVLRAMGRSDELAHSAVRFSIGRFTQEQEIDRAIQLVRDAVSRLRALSPLWDMHQEGVDLQRIAWSSP